MKLTAKDTTEHTYYEELYQAIDKLSIQVSLFERNLKRLQARDEHSNKFLSNLKLGDENVRSYKGIYGDNKGKYEETQSIRTFDS